MFFDTSDRSPTHDPTCDPAYDRNGLPRRFHIFHADNPINHHDYAARA